MKNCPSFPGYSVNEVGDVFSHRTRIPIKGSKSGTIAMIDYSKCRKLKTVENKKGYLQVSIQTGFKIRPIGVHVLVADAFIGKKESGNVVRHIDDNPKNNKPENICYGSHLDNAADRLKNGGYTKGGNHHNSALSNEDAIKIRELRKQKVKVKLLAEQFCVSVATIESIIYGKSYKN